MISGLGKAWDALLGQALEPRSIAGTLGDVITLFAGLGFAELLSDPDRARNQCDEISRTFETICLHHGVPAASVDGFLMACVPAASATLTVPGSVMTCRFPAGVPA